MSVLVTCTACERKLKVRDELLGKTIKCPSCEERFVAQEMEDAEDTPRPGKSRRSEQIRSGKSVPTHRAERPRRDEDEDEEKASRRRPRSVRKEAESNKGLVIGLVVGGVLLLAGVGVGVYLLVGKKEDKPSTSGTDTRGAAAVDNPPIKQGPGPGVVAQNPPVQPPNNLPNNPRPIVRPPARNVMPSSFIVAHGLPTKYMVLNASGTVMASADAQMLKLWDPFTKNHQPLAQFTFLQDPVNALAFAADGKLLAVGRGATVELRDGRNGQVTTAVPPRLAVNGVARNGVCRCLAFQPKGSVLAIGVTVEGAAGKESSVLLWDHAAGKEIRQLKAHDREVQALVFSPDGKLLATAGSDNLVKLWKTDTWTEQAVLRGHNREIAALAFNRDGTQLASAGADNTAIVWDVAVGKEKGRLTGHLAAVLSVAFSPDGKLLATGSADSTVRLWDASSFAEVLETRRTGNTGVPAVAFHPDGNTLFAAVSGMIQLWDLAKVLGR